MQDEFARYFRMDRQANKMVDECSKLGTGHWLLAWDLGSSGVDAAHTVAHHRACPCAESDFTEYLYYHGQRMLLSRGVLVRFSTQA